MDCTANIHVKDTRCCWGKMKGTSPNIAFISKKKCYYVEYFALTASILSSADALTELKGSYFCIVIAVVVVTVNGVSCYLDSIGL